jgi:Ino eighty subunit 1
MWRVYQRLKAKEDLFEDSDEDDGGPRNLMVGGGKAPGLFKEKGMGGLSQLAREVDDYGEQTSAYAAALRRVERRVMRWRDATGETARVMHAIKRRPTRVEPTHLGDITMGDADVEDGDQTIMPYDDQDQPVSDVEDEVEKVKSGKSTKSPEHDKLRLKSEQSRSKSREEEATSEATKKPSAEVEA